MYGPTETPRAGGPKGEWRHRSATGRSEHVPTSPTTATPAPSMTLEHDRGGGVGPLTWLSGYAALQQAGRRVAATPRAAPRRLQPNDGRPGDTTTRLTLFAQPGRPCTNASAPAGHSSTAQPRAREACSDESGAARTQTGQELGPGDNRPTSVPLLCSESAAQLGAGPLLRRNRAKCGPQTQSDAPGGAQTNPLATKRKLPRRRVIPRSTEAAQQCAAADSLGLVGDDVHSVSATYP